MIWRAMIRIHRKLQEEKLKTRMILQVHDELLFDTPLDEIEQAKVLIPSGNGSGFTVKKYLW